METYVCFMYVSCMYDVMCHRFIASQKVAICNWYKIRISLEKWMHIQVFIYLWDGTKWGHINRIVACRDMFDCLLFFYVTMCAYIVHVIVHSHLYAVMRACESSIHKSETYIILDSAILASFFQNGNYDSPQNVGNRFLNFGLFIGITWLLSFFAIFYLIEEYIWEAFQAKSISDRSWFYFFVLKLCLFDGHGKKKYPHFFFDL